MAHPHHLSLTFSFSRLSSVIPGYRIQQQPLLQSRNFLFNIPFLSVAVLVVAWPASILSIFMVFLRRVLGPVCLAPYAHSAAGHRPRHLCVHVLLIVPHLVSSHALSSRCCTAPSLLQGRFFHTHALYTLLASGWPRRSARDDRSPSSGPHILLALPHFFSSSLSHELFPALPVVSHIVPIPHYFRTLVVFWTGCEANLILEYCICILASSSSSVNRGALHSADEVRLCTVT